MNTVLSIVKTPRVLAQLLAVALLAGAGVAFGPLARESIGAIMALAGMALYAVSSPRREQSPAHNTRQASAAPLTVPLTAPLPALHPALTLGVLLLLTLTLMNSIPYDQGVPAALQAVLLLAGAGLVTLGMAASVQGSITPRLGESLRRPEILALLAVLIFALAVRVVDLERAVPRLVDEMHAVRAVTRLWDDPDLPLLSQQGDVTAFTFMYPLAQTSAAAIYGPSLTALRVVSALCGTFTVLALWGLARVLFDGRTALLAALLLAAFPPHVHFSRLGLNNIADPLSGTITLALLARGLRDRRPLDFALAGLALGFTQYFYEGGRLIFPPLALTVALWGRAPRPLLRTFLVTFAVVAAPLYITWIITGQGIFPRLDAASAPDYWHDLMLRGPLGAPLAVLGDVTGPLRFYVSQPDRFWFYGGSSPLVLGWLVPALLLGVAHAVRHLRAPGMALLILWPLLVALGNMPLVEQRDAARYVVVFPALALLIALGMRHAARLIVPRHTGIALLCAGLIASAGQTAYYFRQHLPAYNAQFNAAAVVDDMLFRMGTLPLDTHVYIIGEAVVRYDDVTAYARYKDRRDLSFTILHPSEVTPDFVRELLAVGRLAFFIEAAQPQVAAVLGQAYDLGRVHLSPYDLPPGDQYLLYFVQR